MGGGYVYRKTWGYNRDITFSDGDVTHCDLRYSVFINHFKCCYKSVQYWYQPEGEARINLSKFENNNLTSAAPNPFSGVSLANATYPGVAGADIEFYDTDIEGSTFTPQEPDYNGQQMGCCNYTRDVPSNLPISMTVTANVTSAISSISLPVPVSGTPPTPPARVDNYPAAIKLTAALTWTSGPNSTPSDIAQANAVIQALANGVTCPARVTKHKCGINVEYPSGTVAIPAGNGYEADTVILRSGSSDSVGIGPWYTGYTQVSNGKHEALVFGQPYVYGWLENRKGHAEIYSPSRGGISNARYSDSAQPCGFASSLSLSASGPASSGIYIGNLYFGVTSITRANA